MKREWTGWLLLAGALVVGFLAFWLVGYYLDSREQEMRLDLLSGQASKGRVVVASANLSPGDVVSQSSVAVAEMPISHIPSMAIKPEEFGRIEGRVINRAMSQGEMLQADFITGLVVNRFSGLLDEGERAISVEVSSLKSYSGMLLPGDYIDLYVLLKDDASGQKPRLVPILERVKVLAAGAQPLRNADQSFQRLDANTAQYNMITVGLPREEAERLALAREAGEIAFLMRNADDQQIGVADQSYALFGDDHMSQGGYWYVSSGVPEGEVRLPGQATASREAGAATPVSSSLTPFSQNINSATPAPSAGADDNTSNDQNMSGSAMPTNRMPQESQ
ncbi:Flp pilus assembly protein CpaB [Halomonas sp. SpR1]|uniref:Flp pilus assembly protein CpaB n=1 Tax=Halomonas sp. SpR1 TaxID=3050462 RepID=UPI0027E515A4|nr:Flp pilus assembly protein CpaB [Halomonas sp. SpR1]MDQ7735554.1 Flp pilus assembly protein CpaB [Halomonas sp. SpR1]